MKLKSLRLAKLLIFDLDGTLVDSAPDIINAVNGLMKERGRPPLPDKEIIAAIGEGLKSTIFKLFPECHDDPPAMEKLEADFLAHYEANLTRSTHPFPGLIEFLETLGNETKIAIVTNKYTHLAEDLINLGPLGKFPWLVIFGADSFAQRKPDPLPLIEAMKVAGAKADETVMIGDGTPDMKAGTLAGVKVIACEFGYTDIEILKAHGASVTLKDYASLPSILRAIGLEVSLRSVGAD